MAEKTLNILLPDYGKLTYQGGFYQVLYSGSPVLTGCLSIKFVPSPASGSYANVVAGPLTPVGYTAQSAIEEPADWGRLFAKLDGLLTLPKGWDGYRAVPPNTMGRRHARSFLESLSQENYVPHQVMPSVIGGVGVNRRRGNKKVYVEFNNNGKVHALYSDGTSAPRVEQVQPDRIGFHILIRRMRAYLDE